MTRDAGADRVQMAVNLGVVGVFIAREVAPQEKASHQQYHDSYDEKHAESRVTRLKALPAEISVRRWQRARLICRPLRLRLTVLHRRACVFCHDFTYPDSAGIASHLLQQSPLPSPEIFWRCCANRGWRCNSLWPIPAPLVPAPP